MSKRADPPSGQKRGDDAPKRARQMTVYDRLEDARKRRHALLAKGNGPAPRPAPSLKFSNEPTAEQPRNTPDVPKAAPNPEPAAPAISAPIQPPVPRALGEPADATQKKKRGGAGYWTNLAQAMAAVVLIAVLIALFASRGDAPEDQANATTPQTPQTPQTPVDVASTPISTKTETQASASFEALSNLESTGPEALPIPETTQLDVTIAPLISPVFETRTARLATPAPDSIPASINPDGAPALPLITPPIVLASTPPARPKTQAAQTPAVPSADPGLADRTTVVLLVPAFVPQSDAENAITTAAALGIPVDQTRRAAVSISQTNIRYFHDEDAEAASLLAAGLDGVARDFTSFTPPPNPGVIEIWIEGRGGNQNTSQGSATARGLEADLQALRNSIARALNIATGN